MKIISIKDKTQSELETEEAIEIISPDKSEKIYFEQEESNALIAELNSGKISLTYLAQQLKLSMLPNRLYYWQLAKNRSNQGRINL